MNLDEYQQQARETDQTPGTSFEAVVIPLLGVAGEVGGVLSEWKKRIRDGDSHRLFREQLSEELGDVLWYLSNIASKFDLSLEQVARSNLTKTRGRWIGVSPDDYRLLDDTFAIGEQIPRTFALSFRKDSERPGQILVFHGERRVGNPIRDNSYEADDYRYHDVFHCGFAAVLGWSPIVRYLLKCKRKSDPQTDDVEDGGRAIAIEEGISAYVFNYARDHQWLDGITRLDQELLRTVAQMVRGLEVESRLAADWERAILEGFAAWRSLVRLREGTLITDLVSRTLTVAA